MNLHHFNIPPDNIQITSGENCVVVCAYGRIEDSFTDCVIVERQYKDNYTYLYITDLDVDKPIYKYMDGFSPNLNKKLHIGHFSNLVYASAFKHLGVCEQTIAIYGDTLVGTDLSNIDYNKFKYSIDKEYYASEQVLLEDEFKLLCEGIGEYENTKCFTLLDDTKLVGIKSDASTSYFYQDVSLVQTLNGSTLYLTGKEQKNHFNQLKLVKGLEEYSNNINHIGLGLISLQGEKMSSRKGNVIYMTDLIDIVNQEFNNLNLTYNVLAGSILMSNPTRDLKVSLDNLSDPKQSVGMYISYTTARLLNLPIDYNKYVNQQVDLEVKFMVYKSKMTLNPSLLCGYLHKYCKKINVDYTNIQAKDNEELYVNHLHNLQYMLNKLGLYTINKI